MFESVVKKKLRILDFDIENRPISYLGQDFTTADITAIGAGWVDEKKVYVWALGEITTEEMLKNFVKMWDEAGLVTGHYVKRHDIVHINGALMEFGFPSLSPKLVSCTKEDLKRRTGISASQENLSEMLDIAESKYQMNQIKWRKANRLTKEGIALTKKRVVDDVIQHKQLRQALLDAGYLNAPRMWYP